MYYNTQFFLFVKDKFLFTCVKKTEKCQSDDLNKKVNTFKIYNNLFKTQTKKINWWIVSDNTLHTHKANFFLVTRKRNGNIIQYQSPRLLAIINIFSDSWIFPPHFWIIQFKKKPFSSKSSALTKIHVSQLFFINII